MQTLIFKNFRRELVRGGVNLVWALVALDTETIIASQQITEIAARLRANNSHSESSHRDYSS